MLLRSEFRKYRAWRNIQQTIYFSIYCYCANRFLPYNGQPSKGHTPRCRCGEIGRHDGFKIRFLREWRFKSAHRYHYSERSLIRAAFRRFEVLKNKKSTFVLFRFSDRLMDYLAVMTAMTNLPSSRIGPSALAPKVYSNTPVFIPPASP